MTSTANRNLTRSFWLAILGIGLALSPIGSFGAEQGEAKSERPWRIYLSVAGGKFFKEAFPQDFFYFGDGHLAPTLEMGGDDPARIAGWTQLNSAYLAIPTLGFSYRFLGAAENQDESGWLRFLEVSAIAEVTYVPAHRYPDGLENEAQNTGIIQTFHHPQTDRKAGAWGISTGINIVPYSKIPLGLDIKFGLWFSKLEYLSGTCLYYDGRADMSFLTDTQGGRAMGTYKGQGRWESNHTAFAFGASLKFRPWSWASLDLGVMDLMYLRSEPTNFVYVDSGSTVSDIQVYGLGTILSLGLTFYF